MVGDKTQRPTANAWSTSGSCVPKGLAGPRDEAASAPRGDAVDRERQRPRRGGLPRTDVDHLAAQRE
eukprot:1352995-Prymnesium_polylepis.1